MSLKAALLLITFAWIVLSGFVYRSLLVWRQTGINPVVLPKDDSPQGWIGRQFKVLLVTTLLLLGTSTLWTPTPLWPHNSLTLYLEVFGWFLLLTASALMPLAQRQMGAAWRIGFSENERTLLVTHGLFAWSRNPIFLAIRLALLGWFLIQPHTGSLIILVVGEVLLQVQVRLEESHLSEQIGDTYSHYLLQVPRWL
jgi:protein-S-isoprenylcysteine O-methyltransferase Ste14